MRLIDLALAFQELSRCRNERIKGKCELGSGKVSLSYGIHRIDGTAGGAGL